MSTNRISFGAMPDVEASVDHADFSAGFGTSVALRLRHIDEVTLLTSSQLLRWRIGDKIQIYYNTGGVHERDITYREGRTITVDRWEGTPLDSPILPLTGNGIEIIKVVNLGSVSHGIAISIPGVDVSDPEIAHSGNLMFDTSTFVEDAMYAVQTGSFVLAGYKHRHDPVFHAGNRTNVSISIAETKPAGKELDIPLVMMQFAVCNSTGHFHPNYADSSNSQVLAFMDSIWVKQLNVIGGTINTESATVQGSIVADANKYGAGSQGNRTSEYGQVHWSVPGDDESFLRDHHSTPYGFDSHITPTWSVKPNWQLDTELPPNFGVGSGNLRGVFTSWETLTRPDVNPSNTYFSVPVPAEGGGLGDSLSYDTPRIENLVQVRPVYGGQSRGKLIDRYDGFVPIYNENLKEQVYYNDVGRRGYWKQKTWGLIYYIDHKKIIVQAFNDKSTSNAMNMGAGTNIHRRAWEEGEGDLGRVIASKSPKLQKTFADGLGGGETGGAFNHNLFTTSGNYWEGAGDSFFDYYHIGAGIGDVGRGGGFFDGGEDHAEHTNTTQEHMPRPYLGGWDNFLWDNICIRTIQNTPATSNVSPWMLMSNGLINMDAKIPNAPGTHGREGTDNVLFGRRFHGWGESLYFSWVPMSDNDGPGIFNNSFDVKFGHNAGNWVTYYAMAYGDSPGPWERDNSARPWLKTEDMATRSGVLSYRESITPNTEVTTIISNHFNPLSDADGGEALDKNGNSYGWDYFFVSYVVFNQSVGIQNENQKQHNGSIVFQEEPGEPHILRPDFPLEPWSGQPLHD